MKTKRATYAAGLFSMVIFMACSKGNTEVNTTDRTFTMQSSLSNTVEVSAGTLAATKATNARVKSFAQFMMMEHQMAQADLKNLGTGVGITVSDTIDPAHVAIMTQLTSMASGRAFDSIYIYSQVADHNMALTNFQLELSSGSNEDIRSYATVYLPHIQMHRQSADSIASAYFKR